jgi:hypothetical protein
MGKYFGREPRYSLEEIERQAQEAIDARVSLGRPPAEEWEPLQARLDDIDHAIVARGLPDPEPPRAPAAPLARPTRLRRPVPAAD